jgi:predicted nucleotidyltransferase
LLFGSRAKGKATNFSDYDFAISGDFKDSFEFAKSWTDIANLLNLSDKDIDVINLKNASQALKNSIKEGFIILKGNESEILRLLGNNKSQSR